MKRLLLYFFISVSVLSYSCKKKSSKNQDLSSQESPEVNVYTHRHYKADQELFKSFSQKTGIKVNVVNAKADELLFKMENEGSQCPADVLITVDAGRLYKAKNKHLLQSIHSAVLKKNIPTNLTDSDNQWFGLTKRARVIAYVKEKTKPEQLSTYEALAGSEWKNKILVRSSANLYNQSLLASMIANNGEEEASKWAKSVVQNMARSPKGNDRDQIKALVAGEGEIAIVNTYYVGKLLNSKDPKEVEVGSKISLFFPNQKDRGAHINISGAGVAKYSPNKENAIKFIEFLSSEEAQEVFSSVNFEYPANPNVKPSALLQSWGEFKEDELSLSELGRLNKKAVLMFDKVGWK